MVGQIRNFNNCFPCPCSSTASCVRTPPSRPPRTSRSHVSKSLPSSTTAPWPFRNDSSIVSQPSVGSQDSLQMLTKRGLGNFSSGTPRRLHGVSPCRSLPQGRAIGCIKCNTAVSDYNCHRRFLLQNEACAAPATPCATSGRRESKNGTENRVKGAQSIPTRVSTPIVAETMYHSGI